MEEVTSPIPDRFIRLPHVEHLTGFKRSHLYALAAASEFPKPIKLGRRASAWSEKAVLDWITSRIAGAQHEAAR